MATDSSSPLARAPRWAAAAALLVIAAIDVVTAAVGAGAPYVHAGAPAALLGAATRAAASGILAAELFTRRRPVLRGFGATVAFSLVSLWAPRSVWLYTVAQPRFDPIAPMVASLAHVVGLALAAGAFLGAAAAGGPAAGFWGRQLRGGFLVRVALLAPLLGYPLQVRLMFGEASRGFRDLVWAIGGAWLALLVGAFAAGAYGLASRARGVSEPAARADARAGLAGVAAGVVLYLLVRALSGDLWAWAGSVLADLSYPYGPFSLFAVRASAADPPGMVGLSCAALAAAGVLVGRRRPGPEVRS